MLLTPGIGHACLAELFNRVLLNTAVQHACLAELETVLHGKAVWDAYLAELGNSVAEGGCLPCLFFVRWETVLLLGMPVRLGWIWCGWTGPP